MGVLSCAWDNITCVVTSGVSSTGYDIMPIPNIRVINRD